MSFENALIFPFPAVQYIPLAIHNIQTGMIPSDLEQSNPLLIVGTAISKYSEIFRILLPDNYPSQTCPILALHLKVFTARYRSFFVTMIGKRDPGCFQLFSVPTDRFYKEKLFFEVFEEKSGLQIARYSLFTSPGISL